MNWVAVKARGSVEQGLGVCFDKEGGEISEGRGAMLPTLAGLASLMVRPPFLSSVMSGSVAALRPPFALLDKMLICLYFTVFCHPFNQTFPFKAGGVQMGGFRQPLARSKGFGVQR